MTKPILVIPKSVSVTGVIAIFLIILVIIFRYFSSLPTFKDGDLVKISTTVTTEPIVYEKTQYIKLMGLKTYLPKYPQVTYGDEIVVIGRVNNDKLNNPELIEVGESKNRLYKLRERLILFYKKSLPEPHASLVAGTVLGSKSMPNKFWETLKQTGTAHVVVASGTNVAMVAGFLMGVTTSFLKRKKAIVVTLLGISMYVVLSGFDAPIVRAAIMGAVVFIAQGAGRLVSAWRALVISIVLMLLIKPLWLTDLGFILSVLATSGLMLFQKNIDTRLKFIPNVLREGLTTSISAQIFVAPVIYATFGQFNILSPIINALILWTIPYIMIIGGVGGVVGLIVPKLGMIMLQLVYPLTWFFEKTLSLF